MLKHPPLKKHLQQIRGRVSINFGNPKAVKELNTALLFYHYGIQYWQFPKQNLCPPIPSRADYIHYLNDLPHNNQSVSVLDIGTGATCIYPLLGNAIYGWKFVGTDISEQSLKWANEIIENNRLQDAITLAHQPNPNNIFKGITNNDDKFTFSMCNPPFYASKQEAQESQNRKMRNLNLSEKNFSGLASELWFKGGEQQFITNYVIESSRRPHLCQWFTCLLSKKESLHKFKQLMVEHKAKRYEIIPMQTGNKITRVVAWKF